MDLPDIQPVLKIIRHVVAAERNHRHRIATEHSRCARRCRRRLGSHGGADVGAVFPVKGFIHQRCEMGAASAENNRGDRNTLRILPLGRDARALARRRGEARVRMRGLLLALRGPRIALPVGRLFWHFAVHAFPPWSVVLLQCDIGVDGVLADRSHRVRIRLGAGPRNNAEETGLRVDRVKPAVLPIAHPGDIVAHGPDLVIFEQVGGDQHRQVRLAARARKSRRDVGHVALGAFDAEDEHMLGKPAFAAGADARQPERMTLLSKQGVAAVTGADAPDQVLVRKMADIAALGIEISGAMQAAHEFGGGAKMIQRDLADAAHDPHIDDDVNAVGHLNAHLAERRADRAHQIRHHVHRPAFHRAAEDRLNFCLGVLGGHPVVGRPSVLLPGRANKSQVFDTRNITRIAPRKVTAGKLLPIEFSEDARPFGLANHPPALLLRTIAPEHPVRLRQFSHILHPTLEIQILHFRSFPVFGHLHLDYTCLRYPKGRNGANYKLKGGVRKQPVKPAPSPAPREPCGPARRSAPRSVLPCE